jgi:hypothetical protein
MVEDVGAFLEEDVEQILVHVRQLQRTFRIGIGVGQIGGAGRRRRGFVGFGRDFGGEVGQRLDGQQRFGFEDRRFGRGPRGRFERTVVVGRLLGSRGRALGVGFGGFQGRELGFEIGQFARLALCRFLCRAFRLGPGLACGRFLRRAFGRGGGFGRGSFGFGRQTRALDTATFAGVTRFYAARDFFGEVPIALELSDQGNSGLGGVMTAQATLMLQVLPVNDAPTLRVDDILRSTTDTASQTVELEAQSTISVGPPNESGQIVQGWSDLVVDDVDGVLAAAPTLGPTGKLSFVLSGQAGNAAISVRIADSGGTDHGGVDRSAPAVFQIRVSANAAALFSDGFEGPL